MSSLSTFRFIERFTQVYKLSNHSRKGGPIAPRRPTMTVTIYSNAPRSVWQPVGWHLARLEASCRLSGQFFTPPSGREGPRCSRLALEVDTPRWDRAVEDACPQRRAPPRAGKNSMYGHFKRHRPPSPACCRDLCWNFQGPRSSAGAEGKHALAKMEQMFAELFCPKAQARGRYQRRSQPARFSGAALSV